TLEDLEEALVRADLGASLSHKITQAVAKDRYDRDIATWDLRRVLADEIADVLKQAERQLAIDASKKPFLVLVTGVNGTAKTTTIGKLARRLSRDGRKLVLAAGDTFRAAAIEQLQIWGERTNAEVVSRAAGADAAGVVFGAIERARNIGADVL